MKTNMELKYVMSHSAYKEMLDLNGINSPKDVIDYINDTYGLLGTVVEVVFDED